MLWRDRRRKQGRLPLLISCSLLLLLFLLRGPEPKCWRRSLQLHEKRSRNTGHTIFSYRLNYYGDPAAAAENPCSSKLCASKSEMQLYAPTLSKCTPVGPFISQIALLCKN